MYLGEIEFKDSMTSLPKQSRYGFTKDSNKNNRRIIKAGAGESRTQTHLSELEHVLDTVNRQAKQPKENHRKINVGSGELSKPGLELNR